VTVHTTPIRPQETAESDEKSGASYPDWLAAYRRLQGRSGGSAFAPGATTVEGEPSVAASLTARVTFTESLTTILLSIASAGIVMLTYFGVSGSLTESGGGLLQKGEALAFAVTIGVFSWLGWFYVFGILPMLRGGRLAVGILAGTAYLLAIVAIDARFNMLALAGDAAVQMSLVAVTHGYESRIADSGARTSAVRKLVPGLRTQAVRFDALEKQEVETGGHSGRRGPGKVSMGFGQIRTLLSALTDELERGLAEAETIKTEATKVIAEMKAKTFTQGAIRSRSEAVSTLADRLDELLGRLAQYDYAVSIRTTLASLETSIVAPTAAGSTFEAAQNAGLALIADMARPVARALAEGIAGLGTADTNMATPMRPADPMSAITTYWQPLIAQWIAAIFVDLAPGILLVILVAARREAEWAARHDRKGERP
jgi:hypothetical protein